MSRNKVAPIKEHCQTCANSNCPYYKYHLRDGLKMGLVNDRFALFMTPAAFTKEMGCTRHTAGQIAARGG